MGIREKAFGADHPNVATVLENLAALYTEMGKTDEAERLAERAAKIRQLNYPAASAKGRISRG
jgi:hypothetical protein